MPPIMANSKDGQGHKDKCLDMYQQKVMILSQEMLMCNMKTLIYFEVRTNISHLKNSSYVIVKSLSFNEKVLLLAMRNIKAPALTV